MRLFLPKHDMAFQALFNNYERKNLLIDLINSILMPSGHKPIKDVVLLNPGLEVDFKDDKMPRLDVRAQSEGWNHPSHRNPAATSNRHGRAILLLRL